MTDYPHRVQVEGVRWPQVLPVLNLVGSLRRSLAPARMFLALLLVIFIYLGGKALDFVWGDRVVPNELARYSQYEPAQYRGFLDSARGYQADQLERTGVTTAAPIFHTLIEYELEEFKRLVGSAFALNFGVGDILSGRTGGVIGHVKGMVITAPGWMFTTHPGFSAVFLLYSFVLTMVLGGAITRLAALDACRGMHGSPFDALRFAAHKAGWLIAAPLMPLALVAAIALVLALAGLVFFNLPGLDVIGGLGFGLLLLLGSIAAAVLLGLAVACHLMVPAIAVEDADGFDAVSRSFSYVLSHPWRYAAYLLAALVYGAFGYLLVGLVLFLTAWVTKTFASLLVFAEVGEGVTRLDAMLPDPRLGEIHYEPAAETLGTSAKAAATLISVWMKLLVAVLPAYCVSFYFTATTWAYLLLRRAADGAAFDEIALRESPPPAPDKVEPAPSAPDAE